jgi:hypothetical protein
MYTASVRVKQLLCSPMAAHRQQTLPDPPLRHPLLAAAGMQRAMASLSHLPRICTWRVTWARCCC